MLSKAHIVDTEYSPIYVMEDFSGLFAQSIQVFNQRFKVSINNVWHLI